MKDIYDLLGRIFISMIFLYEMLDILFFWANNKETMTFYGITWRQDLLLTGVLVLLCMGSALVIIGYYANIGAFLLLMYWLPFTLVVHSFWNEPIELQRASTLNFMSNLAVCGGLLLLMANGAGKYSVRRLIHSLRLPR
ncbi:MAG TPA: DoxX family protein [Saprospiraceae bacterium]|nr:DoxX family protein [Saprospiraceae bacterium]